MARRPEEQLGFLAARWRDLVATGRLLLDPEVPIHLKGLPLLGLLYLLWPVDLISDLLVGPGQVDDVGVLLAALALFISLVPDAPLARARGEWPADNGTTIDGRAATRDEE